MVFEQRPLQEDLPGGFNALCYCPASYRDLLYCKCHGPAKYQHHFRAVLDVDITITISLCILLGKGRTGFNEKTDRMLLRLIFISVNTGLCTVVFAFLSVLLFVIYPKELIFTALYFPLGTIYSNTLLASLNVRSYARAGHTPEVYHLQSISSPSSSNKLSAPANRAKSVDLSVRTLNTTGMEDSEESKNPGV
ncbi:hypothetical protein HYDPIDRAFT_113088 [Hydnomerulius pinastri MD-312]|uniref:DUF6534 domain-containing protein n=1 Tax=Hydnomerulius pinastri MD-312 TaxID=994086 RepID=A0A0C9WES2_9AGAM|nr:hypothetical protein HYDPIDRAFT_113088 [Hydnomerulius pinastri MD-312]